MVGRKGQEAQEFRLLTERVRGHKRRIRTEFIPELISWLVMMSERYARTRLAAAREHRDSSDEMMQQVVERCRIMGECIQQLCNCCPDSFGVGKWEEVTTRIGAELGVHIGDPLPDTIPDAARQVVLTDPEE